MNRLRKGQVQGVNSGDGLSKAALLETTTRTGIGSRRAQILLYAFHAFPRPSPWDRSLHQGVREFGSLSMTRHRHERGWMETEAIVAHCSVVGVRGSDSVFLIAFPVLRACAEYGRRFGARVAADGFGGADDRSSEEWRGPCAVEWREDAVCLAWLHQACERKKRSAREGRQGSHGRGCLPWVFKMGRRPWHQMPPAWQEHHHLLWLPMKLRGSSGTV